MTPYISADSLLLLLARLWLEPRGKDASLETDTHITPDSPPSMAGFSYLTHNYLQPAHLPHFTDSDFEFVRVSDFKTKEGETTQTCPEVNSSLNVLTA